MFEDDSVEVIYCSHVLEYFDRGEACNVISEWRRVLKVGGVLRIAVPNFSALVAVYEETGELDNILGPMYGKMKVPTSKGTEFLFHKTVYDFVSLEKMLRDNGFKNVEEYDWRLTEHAEFDDHSQAYLPHMDKESGTLMSLNVECEK